MTANSLIAFMKNGTVGQDGFDGLKDCFHHPEFFVSQGHIFGSDIQIGLQALATIISGFLTNLTFIDLKALSDQRRFQILAIAQASAGAVMAYRARRYGRPGVAEYQACCAACL